MKRNLLFVPFLSASILATTIFAHAQPDLNAAPKGANPPIMNPGGGGMFGMNMGDLQKMTPEQRRAAMLKMTEQTLRMTMAMMGYTDKAVQDAVVETALAHEKSLDEVRAKNRVVIQALTGQATDDQMATALEDLQTAQDDAATDRKLQIAELDKKIDFSDKPRLKAYLTLSGVIGDGSAQMSGVLGNIMGAMTNMMMDQGVPQAAPLTRR